MTDQTAFVKRKRAPARNQLLWAAALLAALLLQKDGITQEVGDGAGNAEQYFRLAQFRRGDVNIDGSVDVSDALGIFNWLFLGGGDPPCLAAADANRDGSVNISDPSYTLRWLFLGGADHPAPSACGRSTDAGDMAQGCETATCAE